MFISAQLAQVEAQKDVWLPEKKFASPIGLKEQTLPSDVGVRYLYQPGELEGGA